MKHSIINERDHVRKMARKFFLKRGLKAMTFRDGNRVAINPAKAK